MFECEKWWKKVNFLNNLLKNWKKCGKSILSHLFCATKTTSLLSDLFLPTEGIILSISTQTRAVLSKTEAHFLGCFSPLHFQNGRAHISRPGNHGLDFLVSYKIKVHLASLLPFHRRGGFDHWWSCGGDVKLKELLSLRQHSLKKFNFVCDQNRKCQTPQSTCICII